MYHLFMVVDGSVTKSCPTLCKPMDRSLPGSSVHGIFPGKNTGVGCHFLLQGIFLTQELNEPRSPALQTDSLLTKQQGKCYLFIVLHLISF